MILRPFRRSLIMLRASLNLQFFLFFGRLWTFKLKLASIPKKLDHQASPRARCHSQKSKVIFSIISRRFSLPTVSCNLFYPPYIRGKLQGPSFPIHSPIDVKLLKAPKAVWLFIYLFIYLMGRLRETFIKNGNQQIHHEVGLIYWIYNKAFFCKNNLHRYHSHTVHPWCDDHSTSISIYEVWGARIGFKSLKRSFIHIYT